MSDPLLHPDVADAVATNRPRFNEANEGDKFRLVSLIFLGVIDAEQAL